ncbi:MAG: barstar family protein [Minisyncoccia bacterium]
MKKLVLTIDCAKTKTATSIHQSIASQLSFPTYYGHNLDALHDCLSDTLLEHAVILKWKDTAHSKKIISIKEIKALLKTALA